jgi:hypothetical protein
MKPAMKLGLLVCALALIIGSAPSAAIPSACHLKCTYPDTCRQQCLSESGQWITCYQFFGGSCEPW